MTWFSDLQEHTYTFLVPHNICKDRITRQSSHVWLSIYLQYTVEWILKHRSSHINQTDDASLFPPLIRLSCFWSWYSLVQLSHTYFVFKVHLQFSAGSTVWYRSVFKSGLRCICQTLFWGAYGWREVSQSGLFNVLSSSLCIKKEMPTVALRNLLILVNLCLEWNFGDVQK